MTSTRAEHDKNRKAAQGTTNTRPRQSRPDERTTASDDAGNEHRGRPPDGLNDERLRSGAGKEPATTDDEERRERPRRRSSTTEREDWTGEPATTWGPRRSGQSNNGRADDTLRPEASGPVAVRSERTKGSDRRNVESEKRNEQRAINDITEPNGAERRQPGRRGRADGPRKR